MELEKKAKLFRAYSRHDGMLQRLDDCDKRMEGLEQSVQTQQALIDKQILDITKKMEMTKGNSTSAV